ncbi:Hsp70 family protein [Aspergillus melleus]|uniref:Hsp70 family protein n=1 Tax=Aspergillus melleus TaxID=138277 RepID=UPI001E8E6E2E|nr:uncharacterized protein LDX57_008227 [Aspergillus melleus]KAH8430563.1 hypothetical protein LDX57_008227 [Aspergillus melleus]
MVFCFTKPKDTIKKDPIEVHIGIDLGNNSTGAAYSVKGSSEIRDIDDWPGTGGRAVLQVPTAISSSTWGYTWGYKTYAMADEKVTRDVKVLAEKYEAPKSLLKRVFAPPPNFHMGRYLEGVKGHVEDVLQNKFGQLAKNMKLQYCLTVSDDSSQAQSVLKIAASWASIPDSNLRIVSESDAALRDCFRASYTDNPRENDVVLLVNAGHQKVSVGAYQMSSKRPTRFESLQGKIEGATQSCGSAMLDDHFEKLMIKLLGDKTYSDLPRKTHQTAMRHWQDIIKPSFGKCLGKDEKEDVTYFVPIPGVQDDLSVGIKGGYLMIDKAQIQGIFDPVIQQVKDLLSSQIISAAAAKKEVKVIALVGGFGSSEYLLQQLSVAYPKVKVLQRPNAWSSAARGAVLHSLDGPQKIARRHYGIKHTEIFNPKVHKEEDKYWDPVEGKYMGDEIGDDNTDVSPWYHVFWLDASLSGSHEFYACDKDKAPDVFTKGEVRRICKYQYNFNSVPKSAIPLKKNLEGGLYCKVEFEIILTAGSENLKIEDRCNGIICGSTKTAY